MSAPAMTLTTEDVLLVLREQKYVPVLTHRQAKTLAAEYGTEYAPRFWAPTVELAVVAELIANHLNTLEAPNA